MYSGVARPRLGGRSPVELDSAALSGSGPNAVALGPGTTGHVQPATLSQVLYWARINHSAVSARSCSPSTATDTSHVTCTAVSRRSTVLIVE